MTHILDIHGTGTKHIISHSQKSGLQWSVISKFACIISFVKPNMLTKSGKLLEPIWPTGLNANSKCHCMAP